MKKEKKEKKVKKKSKVILAKLLSNLLLLPLLPPLLISISRKVINDWVLVDIVLRSLTVNFSLSIY